MSARRGVGRWPWLAALACAALGLHAAGCLIEATSGGGEPCNDMVTFQLSTPGGAWTEGRYELTMTLDGEKRLCVLDIDHALPANGWLDFSCDSPPVRAYLSNQGTCQSPTLCETDEDYTLQGLIYGSPDRLRIELRRDGQTLLDQQVSPTYSEHEISGGEICRSTPPLTFRISGG